MPPKRIECNNGDFVYHGDALDIYELHHHQSHILIFDPPWDQIGNHAFAARSENIIAFCDGRRAGDVVRLLGAPAWVFVWDCVSSWYTPNRPLQRGKLAFWYGDVTKWNQAPTIPSGPRRPRVVRNTRSKYLFVPDDKKRLADVYSHPITRLHSNSSVSHSKPIEWVTGLISGASQGASIVIDPFAGSGASRIASMAIGLTWAGGDIIEDRAKSIANLTQSDIPATTVQRDLFTVA